MKTKPIGEKTEWGEIEYLTEEEIKIKIKQLYARLGKRYYSVSERRPIEKEIRELKRLLKE